MAVVDPLLFWKMDGIRRIDHLKLKITIDCSYFIIVTGYITSKSDGMVSSSAPERQVAGSNPVKHSSFLFL